MHIFEKRAGKVLLLKVCGRLYSKTVPSFERELARHLEGGVSELGLDLENLHGVNSAGLRALQAVALRLEAAGGKLAFCACGELLRDTLARSGLCANAQLFHSLEDSLDFFGLPPGDGDWVRTQMPDEESEVTIVAPDGRS
ncbi:MAG: STAS domain-containing protein [Pseudomonadota bacterium]